MSSTRPAVWRGLRHIYRILEVAVCIVVSFLMGFGTFIYANVHFQIIQLRHVHRTVDLAELSSLVWFYSKLAWWLTWPTWLLFVPVYLFIPSNSLSRRWLVSLLVGITIGGLVAYLRTCGLHLPSPMEKRYLSSFVPRTVIASGSLFLFGSLIILRRRRHLQPSLSCRS